MVFAYKSRYFCFCGRYSSGKLSRPKLMLLKVFSEFVSRGRFLELVLLLDTLPYHCLFFFWEGVRLIPPRWTIFDCLQLFRTACWREPIHLAAKSVQAIDHGPQAQKTISITFLNYIPQTCSDSPSGAYHYRALWEHHPHEKYSYVLYGDLSQSRVQTLISICE